MPGNPDGSLDGIALTPLTVAFHEPGFIATLQAENQQPFWFQMSADQRQRAGNPMGPANPQALNRYSYVQNNPLRWTDPTGHTWYLNHYDAARLALGLRSLANDLSRFGPNTEMIGLGIQGAGVFAAALGASEAVVVAGFGTVGPILTAIGASTNHAADHLNEMARLIEMANIGDPTGSDGVILEYRDGGLYATNRRTGQQYYLDTMFWVDGRLPKSLEAGSVVCSSGDSMCE